MVVLTSTREELKNVFLTNLNDLVKDREIKDYMVSMLDSFVYDKSIKKEELPDSVVVAKLFEEGKFKELVEKGDSYMFLCGWFPSYVSSTRRKSMGINFYVEKGIDSYNYANHLIYQNKMNENAAIFSKLASNFKDNVGALISLKKRLSGTNDMTIETIFEFEKANVYRNNLGLNNYIPTIKERMEKSNIRLIK